MRVMPRKIVYTVSCRTNSSRLPAKAFLPIAGRPSVLFLMQRLFPMNALVLATSSEESDDALSDLVSNAGFDVYRGSLNDVYSRLFGLLLKSDCEYLVRITADCPLIDRQLVEMFMAEVLKLEVDWDIATNRGGVPPGLEIEIISRTAMIKAATLIDAQDREHVTTVFYRNPDLFNISFIRMDSMLGTSGNYLLDNLDDFLFFAKNLQENLISVPTIQLVKLIER